MHRSLLNVSLVCTAFLTLGGCTNKAVYDSVQNDRKREYQKLPDYDRKRCLESYATSYEDYERERAKVLSDDEKPELY